MTAKTYERDSHNMPHFSNPAAKTWVASLLEVIFGADTAYETRTQDASSPPPPFTEPLPPINSDSGEAFRSALMDATTKFANRHVKTLNRLNPLNVFSVREVYIEFSGAPDQFVADITDWPSEVRNECVKLIIEDAPGAKELLTLQDYFGSTIVTDIKLVKGKVVVPLVSYAGSRFEIKLAFDGGFTQRPTTKPVASPVSVATPAAPVVTPQSMPFKVLDEDFDDVTVGTALREPEDEFDFPDSSGTPLAVPNTDQGLRCAPIATLRLRSLDLDVTVPLMKADFPYTIGRHNSFKGYCVQSRSETTEDLSDIRAAQMLGELEPSGFVSFVSRGHIVLDSYDELNQQFRVITRKGKNGTFFRAATMPTHFLLPLSEMAKGEWLKLGGTSGDGILELRIEAV